MKTVNIIFYGFDFIYLNYFLYIIFILHELFEKIFKRI